MKKTSNISLGGYAFVIEEDAREALERYLGNVRSGASEDVREELVTDIEKRLAEIFLERCGKGVVVDIKTVDDAAARIGIPEDGGPEDHGTASDGPSTTGTSADFLKRKLFRDVENRMVGGVLAGISNWSGIDLILLRLVTAVLLIITFLSWKVGTHHIFSGIVVAYLLLWLIVPAAKTVEDKCKAQGKPVNFDDFKLKAETFRDSVEKTAREVSTAPALKAFARAIEFFVGVVFIIAGMAISIVSLVTALSVPSNFAELPWIIRDAHVYEILTALTGSPVIIWTAIASVAVLGISFLYSGVMTAFGLKSPKWHPGLLLFLLWIGLVITCAVFAAKEFALAIPWTFV